MTTQNAFSGVKLFLGPSPAPFSPSQSNAGQSFAFDSSASHGLLDFSLREHASAIDGQGGLDRRRCSPNSEGKFSQADENWYAISRRQE